MDDNQEMAVQNYEERTGRTFIPGEVVEIPIETLMFSEHQQVVWVDIESYKKDRCIYDPETNDWLVWYVTEFLLGPDIPPIYVDILPDGLALVDGVHRVTAAFISGRPTILAQLNRG